MTKPSVVCHLTSVHPRHDTRIFIKETRSLARAGYRVSLVVADGLGDSEEFGLSIYDVGSPRGRLDRMWRTARAVFAKGKAVDADIYHLHDPELIPVGLKLKRLGKTVIFDSHEDVPKQLLAKTYLSQPSRWLLSNLYKSYEAWACSRFDAIVGATPSIREKFIKINSRCVDINNYPELSELNGEEVDRPDGLQNVCYVGGISTHRGIREMVCALEHTRSAARLQLGGKFFDSEEARVVTQSEGWKSVDQLGWLDRSRVRDVMSRSAAGLVTLHPLPNHIESLPVKMFEYMSMGLPVIASDFPLWRKIIETNECGICVDPLDCRAIAQAIDHIIENPEKARKMGANGRKAVSERYNWGNESKKLIALYRSFSNKVC